LRAVEGLDLRLLVERQHHGMRRRIDVALSSATASSPSPSSRGHRIGPLPSPGGGCVAGCWSRAACSDTDESGTLA
jgi:hypothetical protein